MIMTMNLQRSAEDVFWNLAALLTNYVLEVPATRLSADAFSGMRPQVRICVPLSEYRALPDTVDSAAKVAAGGMRPVITVAAPEPTALRDFDRAVAELAAVGVRELILRPPASTSLAEALDGATRVVRECDLRGRNFTGVTIAAGGLALHRSDPPVDLPRAFDAARLAGERAELGLSILAPQARSVEAVVEWERTLRAAGNRLPVRVRLPGIGPSPFRRVVPMLLGFGAAVEADPASMLTGAHFMPRGSGVQTSEFADEISCGNFLVKQTSSGYQLCLL